MDLLELRDRLYDEFNESELRSLCFDLKINFEDLPGETHSDHAREVVTYCQRNGLISNLIKRYRELRESSIDHDSYSIADWLGIPLSSYSINSSSSVPPLILHPFIAPSDFTGRFNEMEQLSEWLQSSNEPGMIIHGIGGMGKSSLIWHWLNKEVFDNNQDMGVIWWSFYQPEASFDRFLVETYKYIFGKSVEASEKGRVTIWKEILISMRQMKILIIWDGFERLLRNYHGESHSAVLDSVLSEEDNDFRLCADRFVGRCIQEVTQGRMNSKIVVTSRLIPSELERYPGSLIAGYKLINLTGMDINSATHFLVSKGIRGSKAALQSACRILGNHPLSLTLFAGLLAEDPFFQGDSKFTHEIIGEVQSDRQAQAKVLQGVADRLPVFEHELISRLSSFRSSMNGDEIKLICDLVIQIILHSNPSHSQEIDQDSLVRNSIKNLIN